MRKPLPVRLPPLALAAVGLGIAVACLYSFVVERALEAFAPRTVAGAVLAMGCVSLGVPSRALGAGRWIRAFLLGVPLVAVVSGDVVYLLLVPAFIQAGLAGVFLWSLRGSGSLLQEAAHYVHPYAPDFIGPYCRKVTFLFAALFLVQAIGLGRLALQGPDRSWALSSALWIWGPLSAACLVEWAVRKSWFRYYGDGPIDRRLRRWLPPERTETGRRSLAYIRRMREQLGMPPP